MFAHPLPARIQPFFVMNHFWLLGLHTFYYGWVKSSFWDHFSQFQDLIENEWWDIEAVFTALIAIVEAAQKKALKPLQSRREAMENEAKKLKDELEDEINKIKKTISELDNISSLEDHILFLQVRGKSL